MAVLVLLSAAGLIGELAHARISDGIVRIGVLNDESGTYAALAGPGSRVAALMAVEDFGAAAKGLKVEVVLRVGNTNDLRQRSLRPWAPSP